MSWDTNEENPRRLCGCLPHFRHLHLNVMGRWEDTGFSNKNIYIVYLALYLKSSKALIIR